MSLRSVQRLPLLALGLVALVVGVLAGLARVGWSVPLAIASAAPMHGPLMIGGFLGTVIALERAVALRSRWAYLGPLLCGLGGVAAILAASAAAALVFAGSVVLLAASLDVLRRQRAFFTFTLALGALCWVVGNALWLLGSSVHMIIGWWLAFPVLTIAAERLELSRFLPPSTTAKSTFAVIVVVLLSGTIGGTRSFATALFAIGLIALAGWLATCDVARRTVRLRGLPRFIALCLLCGYAWLAVGGFVILGAQRLAPGSAPYDAAVHAIALGFVFSMIFGHAPIILPAVARVAMPYRKYFYAPLVLLHASLALRLGGDAAGNFEWTRAGALLNALALASFVGVALTAVVRGRRAS